MKLFNRDSLKDFFQKGKSPSQIHFEYLIDSTVNKLDDGISITDSNGLQLAASKSNGHVISFYEDQVDQSPAWQISMQKNAEGRGLAFNNYTDGKSCLFLSHQGKAGFGTTQPEALVDVNGPLRARCRIGYSDQGKVLGTSNGKGEFLKSPVTGDGEWHPIIEHLDGPQAFEIVARIDGAKGRNKYAFLHAIAISTYGGKSTKGLTITRANTGWFWNRLELKWTGTSRDYALEIRTRSHYGYADKNQPDSAFSIHFHTTQLWG